MVLFQEYDYTSSLSVERAGRVEDNLWKNLFNALVGDNGLVGNAVDGSAILESFKDGGGKIGHFGRLIEMVKLAEWLFDFQIPFSGFIDRLFILDSNR